MPFALPTVVQFKAKFPELATGINDPQIQHAIEEASITAADQNWINEPNYQLGILYYAAHLVSMGNTAALTGGSTSIDATPRVIRYKSYTVGYNNPSQGQGSTMKTAGEWLDQTLYGQYYLRLLRLNFPAVVVV